MPEQNQIILFWGTQPGTVELIPRIFADTHFGTADIQMAIPEAGIQHSGIFPFIVG